MEHRKRVCHLKGYSLIELLIVIFFLAILSGFLFSSYITTLREEKSSFITMEKEREIIELQNFLRKIIGSIGFGITKDLLTTVSVDCTDNNLSNFKNALGVMGIAKDCYSSNVPTHDRLYFRSLYSTGKEKAGCWWVIEKDSKVIKTISSDKFINLCEINDNDDMCLFMDFNRNFIGWNKCNNTDYCSTKFCLIFYYNSTNDAYTPQVFRLHLSKIEADDISQKQRCAPGSGKLMIQHEWNSRTFPIFDCIGGLKFQPVGTLPNNLPQALRICLLVQVSGRMNSRKAVPSSSSCGAFQVSNPSWEYYRWRIIEEIVPLENLK